MTFETKTLGTVARYVNGRAFKPDEWEEKGLPIIRIQNLTNPNAKYNYTSAEFEEKYLVNNGDLLFAWSASLGAHIWKQGSAWLNQHIFKVIPNNDVDRDYLYYYLRKVVAELYQKAHGTGMVHITKAPFMATTIPIPDLESQRKIVSQIEESLSQLDSAVETLKKTKQQLEVYRQAVLTEAFSGRLTQTWRENHLQNTIQGLIKKIQDRKNCVALDDTDLSDYEIKLSTLPNNWKWIIIGNITSGTEYGTSKKSAKDGEIPVVRMGNIKNGLIDWNDLVFSNDKQDNEHYLLHEGDVLFNRTNSPELVGKTAIYHGERPAIYAGYLIRINQYGFINPEYLNYYMNSATAKSYGNKVKTDGVNQSNINSKKLCSYPFPVCSEEEQEQVVIELKSRLSMCDNIEKTVEQTLQQAEALRQSILKQAFEGE
jgi:type I restriction enzyme S subunit